MDIRGLRDAMEASPDPKRAVLNFEALRGAIPPDSWKGIEPQAANAVAALLAGSRWLPSLLVQHPDWMELFHDAERLGQPRRKEGLEWEVQQRLNALPVESGDAARLDILHDCRLRELLRIAIRDLGRLGSLSEILLELSNAADVFLDGILDVVWQQQVSRFGQPWHRDVEQRWRKTPFAVLGLGKLGGQELNYSSDVDLLFVYGDEGGTYRAPPKPRQTGSSQVLPNHQFFKRLGETLIREATLRGPEGGGLRIDMRLRPEGDSGPLARSLESYENFYAGWGQSWERMMLIKARGVAGDGVLAGEFLETVQPFRHPRSMGVGLLKEMSAMKERIEREVVRPGELDRNIKLGRGGIREIEFVVQVLQVLHGGRNPFLQNSQTLGALTKLTGYGLLTEGDATALRDAYHFLREVEHRLQMEDHRQTHTLPEDPEALERIARLMVSSGRTTFDGALRTHTRNVRSVYELVLGGVSTETPPDPLPPGFDAVFATDWLDLLSDRGFREPEKAARLCRAFIEGTGVGHVSRRTSELGRQLLARLLELCPEPLHGAKEDNRAFILSDPDRVLARLDSYISHYGARSSLYELWSARPNVFEHILKLFDRSEFLAELALREPDLVDELEVGAHLNRQKDALQTLADLRHGRDDPDQHLWLRQYFQTEFMRLGLRDILGRVEIEEANRELTALAEACIQYTIEVVARRHRMREAPFAVIGLGKLGGSELVYGSDLDIIFVAADGTRNLPTLQKMAGEVIDLLSARTPQGSVFLLDTRLRPDGEKGLLVNVLKSHEEYYRHRAMLWEIQALTRARWIAGHSATGAAFGALAKRLTDFSHLTTPPAAYSPGWKSEIAAMRRRIEVERTGMGKEALAFKTGAGGLVDAEFLAQVLAMENGWFEPNTIRSLELARERGVLDREAADLLITNVRHLRRMESILRRWSFEGEAALPDDPQARHRVAVRCGYRSAAALLEDLTRWRAEIRLTYASVLTLPASGAT